MKAIRFALLTVALSFGLSQANAQKVRLIDGNLDAIKGAKKMNLQFDYNKMGVGKFSTEEEYLSQKTADYNKKESGKGDTWAKSWVADRKNRFEPQFKELYAKYCDIMIGDYASEKYTLIFKTTFIEPGYNIYISRKNAEIDGEAWIVETANPSNVIAKMSVQNCPGRTFGGNDYDTGERIQESYATAGKGLGKFLDKELR
jgi:hypothetical protein